MIPRAIHVSTVETHMASVGSRELIPVNGNEANTGVLEPLLHPMNTPTVPKRVHESESC